MTSTYAETVHSRSGYALPLVVAVTGHRDLLEAEKPGIAQRVRAFLEQLRKDYPHRRLQVLSPLAEGADQLVAAEALSLGIELVVPLPMALDIYATDFASNETRADFDHFLSQATAVFELPLAKNNKPDDIRDYGRARDYQYAQLGIFLCAHCHILLALWDGKWTDDLGGTAQVVRFHHDDTMPGFTSPEATANQALVDDESDLVYHIVCSRARERGAVGPALEPLQCWWFSKDQTQPRSPTLPNQHHQIFSRGDEFSADAIAHAEEIKGSGWPLLPDDPPGDLPEGLEEINHMYCIADWLAIHFQKKVVRTLKATHMLAFLMGLMFVLYSDLFDFQIFMVAFLVFFIGALVMNRVASRGGWHRKYLDYRALAEGLRVQFYWAAAGVRNETDSKYTHDMFLQSQDPELGWIRNVMRVAGTQSDAAGNTASSSGLDFTLKEWVGDAKSGQLAYFHKKTTMRIKQSKQTDRLTMISLVVSALVIGAMVLFGGVMPDGLKDPLLAGMGATLLLVGVRQGYAFATAEKELIKQYEFMLRIFHSAHRRLSDAKNDAERRAIIKSLGISALNEHAEWILFHRDRSPDEGEIWMMGQ